jgi:hypothetical protein
VVKTFYIIDRLVKHIHTVILSFAALVGLFVLPPVGIILLLYLRGFLRYGALAE